ncbi:MAG TPA: hypothetical protein PK537_12335 [Candidatus Limiplasma sp.]|nr:hypothetical protein [Candidatus Limiplasma sp.]
MAYKQQWNTLPRWVQGALHTVLGLAAVAAVGYLGYWLAGVLLAHVAGVGLYAAVLWKAAGALLLISLVLLALGTSEIPAGKTKPRRNRPHHDSAAD